MQYTVRVWFLSFLCEAANPPRKVLFCDTCGPAANCLWVIAAHATKPTGHEEKPARTRIVSRTLSPRPRRRLPPSQLLHGSAHLLESARPPAALAPATRSPPQLRRPRRTGHLRPCSPAPEACKIRRVLLLPQGPKVSTGLLIQNPILKSSDPDI